jgi:hypothetical protein
VVTGVSSETLVSGAQASWSSAFRCENAPDEGSYAFTVTLSNTSSSEVGLTINEALLSHTTPRPRGQGPEATAEFAGLPLTLEPGESKSFTVSGTYKLVSTDEGKKANLHFCARGESVSSGEPFCIGFNAIIRGSGASEEGDDPDMGPPDIAGFRIQTTPAGVIVTWTTDRPATTQLAYMIGDDASTRRAVAANCNTTTSHRVVLNDLQPNQRYTFELQGRNGASTLTTIQHSFRAPAQFGRGYLYLAFLVL